MTGKGNLAFLPLLGDILGKKADRLSDELLPKLR